MPHRWFLKKLRILERNFVSQNLVRIYPTASKREFKKSRDLIIKYLALIWPCISSEIDMSFPILNKFAWELSVFDAGLFFFTKENYETESDYPSSVFIKRVSTITPEITFFNRRKTKRKIRSNSTA